MSVLKLCFVCMGNIVRSPLAENLFLHQVAEAGLEQHYTAASAGIISYHVGQHPDPRMRQVAARRGLKYDGRARQFEGSDFSRFDLILAMDTENLADLRAHAAYWNPPEAALAKIRLLREFDPQGGPGAEVPDPYYGGVEGFERVYEIVDRSCRGLLQRLEEQRQAGAR